MTIGIIGAGSIGQAIAKRHARAGIPASISNSRGPSSLSSIVQAIGAGITAAELKVAAKADVVFLAVPWSAHTDAVAGLARWGQPHRDRRHECSLLWTEICLAYPVLSALGEGYEVFIVTDASGGVSVEAHQMAIQRMVQAGAAPLTWIGFASELQRDWAREKTIAGIGEIMSRHGGNIGTSLAWEFQLLGTQPQTKRA